MAKRNTKPTDRKTALLDAWDRIEIAKAERDQWRGLAEKLESALSAAASNVLALQCDAARWRECERLAYPASPMVDKWWRITVFGDTFADAIDASIAARGDG